MKKIAIFCAGTHGILFYEILKTCNIHINCFVDNSEDKWNKIIVDDVKCLKPDIFLSGSYIVYVCVDRKHYNNIIEEIKKLDAKEDENVMKASVEKELLVR